MRNRIELQPLKTVSSGETQETRYAVPLGNAKAGVAFVNTLAMSGSAMKITFETATAPDRGTTFWAAASSELDCTAAGTKSIALSNLGDILRWHITTWGTSGSGTFQIVVFLTDT